MSPESPDFSLSSYGVSIVSDTHMPLARFKVLDLTEQLATIDVISGGKLTFGAGRISRKNTNPTASGARIRPCPRGMMISASLSMICSIIASSWDLPMTWPNKSRGSLSESA